MSPLYSIHLRGLTLQQYLDVLIKTHEGVLLLTVWLKVMMQALQLPHALARVQLHGVICCADAFQAPLYGDGEQMNQRVASAGVLSDCEQAFIRVKDSLSQKQSILVRKTISSKLCLICKFTFKMKQ